MKPRRAIVSVGVSQSRVLDLYINRMERSFAEHGCADEMFIWDQHWPPNSLPHRDCNYGFKVHAVDYARFRGIDSILWFDASCYAIKSVEPLWQRLERDGHVLIEDAERLGKWSSDASLRQFDITRDEAMKFPLMCGTCWGVDLRTERSRVFFDRLLALATPENFNGTHVSRHPGLREHPRPGTEGAKYSDDERCWGHRSDEVYMSLLARELGMQTHVGIEFVGGGAVTEAACVRSGYDL
jgi:hypothetical protein